jgi:hypothetical protein
LDVAGGTLTGLNVNGFDGTDLSAFGIAELTFSAVGPGTSLIDISLGTSPDGLTTFVWGENGTLPVDANPDFVDAQATVVPLPAAAWLFAGGLLGVGGVGLRQRRSN